MATQPELKTLGLGFGALGLLEQHVVGAVGVEGRVQVDEVNGVVGDVLAQHLHVVAVVEDVGVHHLAYNNTILLRWSTSSPYW